MPSLHRRIGLTLLAASLSLGVLASAYAQEAEEPVAGDEAAFVAAPEEIIGELPVFEFVEPTLEASQPIAEAPLPTVVPAPSAAPQSIATPAPATSSKLAVTVIDNRFQPTALTITPGTTVTWTNNGNNIHTLTSPDGGFDSGGLIGGASFSFTFDKAGTYRLICRQHGLNGMAGQIVVQ